MIEGKLSCYVIYQDDDCIAILDKYPIDNGHSLVITKKPYEKLTDMDVDEVAKLFSKIPKIANAIIKATNADAFSIAQNNGKAAKQIVPHVHVHIIPRQPDDLAGPVHSMFKNRPKLSDDELDKLCTEIKNS